MPSKISNLYSKDDPTMIVYPNVQAANIPSNAITADKVADGAITTAKVNDGAITAAKIASNAVTSGKIASQAVTTGKIDDGAITTAKVNDGAITTDKLASNSVTGAKIKMVYATLHDYMVDKGITFTLGHLDSTIRDLLSKGYRFFWNDDSLSLGNYGQVIPCSDEDGSSWLWIPKFSSMYNDPMIDAQADSYKIEFAGDADVSQFMNGVLGDCLFIQGLEY